LHDLVPNVTRIGFLINPDNRTFIETTTKEETEAAATLGIQVHPASISSDRDFDPAFESLAQLRVGALDVSDDPFHMSRRERIADLGWTDGRNMRMDLRWAGGDINRVPALAHELVRLQPDIIVANGGPPTIAVQRETRTIPIVFAGVGDPVARGIVARLDRPGGNVTGFALLEPSLGGKRELDTRNSQDVSLLRSTLQRQRIRANFTSSFLNFESNRTIQNVQSYNWDWNFSDPFLEEIGWNFGLNNMTTRFQDVLHSIFRKLKKPSRSDSVALRGAVKSPDGNHTADRA
jgi:hypothetical protein